MGRIGRDTRLPPQFGQHPLRFPFTHSRQNVHSNVQIMASVAAGGKSLSQHSQLGRSSSMMPLRCYSATIEYGPHRESCAAFIAAVASCAFGKVPRRRLSGAASATNERELYCLIEPRRSRPAYTEKTRGESCGAARFLSLVFCEFASDDPGTNALVRSRAPGFRFFGLGRSRSTTTLFVRTIC